MHGNVSIAAPLLTAPFRVIAERVCLRENPRPLVHAKSRATPMDNGSVIGRSAAAQLAHMAADYWIGLAKTVLSFLPRRHL